MASRVFINSTSGSLTDRSGTTSASLSTSTVLMPANLNRKYLFIQNVGAGDIWINFGIPAVTNRPSIQLPAGSVPFIMDGGYVCTDEINVISTLSSVPYTAKEA